MIHLDANYLIALTVRNSSLRSRLQGWLAEGEKLAASAVAWSEFLAGPATAAEMKDVAEILEGRIVFFGIAEAEKSAFLFNQTGRKRQIRVDGFIAATAICANASLATENRRDFLPFTTAGLRLA